MTLRTDEIILCKNYLICICIILSLQLMRSKKLLRIMNLGLDRLLIKLLRLTFKSTKSK